MKHKRNWIVGIVLSATAAVVALQTVSAPEQEETTSVPPITFTAEIQVTETDTPIPWQGCAYVWAYYGAPELTATLDAAIKELDSAASAVATKFGEDCVSADGTTTFGVMETDFTIRLPVEDLTKEEEFGNWMAQVMQIVIQIPREEIPGPNYGFVEFWFEKNESEHIVFRVPIQDYLNKAQGKSGAELFRMFYQQP